MTRWTGLAVALGAALSWSRAAAAEPAASPLHLTWVSPRGCPDGRAVEAEVLRLAGSRTLGPLDASGVIEADGDAWRLLLTTTFDGSSGERRLAASSCRALTEAAVLTLALILNPETELPTAAPAPQPAPVQEAPGKPPAAPPERAPTSNAAPLRLRGLIAAYGGMHAGITGSPGFEVGLGAGIAIERVAFRLAASFSPPHDVHVSGDSGPGGRLWFLSGNALGCVELGRQVLVGPCAGVALTRVSGEGLDVASPESGVTHWLSLLFGLTAGVPVSRAVTLGGGAYALVPTHRPTLFLDDLGPVQRPAPVGLEVRAGAELSFP